jgi:hypothetical protein
LLPGNEIQRKWKNIRDSFRKEALLQKKVASGQGVRKRHKQIYLNQLLFLLPTMQELGTSGCITPPPNVNESETQDVTTGHQVGECWHAKDATYRQQKKRSKTTNEESFF